MGLYRELRKTTLLAIVDAHNFFLPPPQADSGSELAEIDEIRARAVPRTDISDHLIALFVEALAVRPRLIVELGVRSGESTFALERVAKLCGSTLVSVEVDVLLIDTNHVYVHTVKEIAHWFPFLSPKAKVFFHDTNMHVLFHRKDKSLGVGWQRNRGVMTAIEEYLGTTYNENASFTDVRKGWIIRHNALCSGFTVLERLNFSEGNGAGPHDS
jgi:hypothetical protein